jgi:pilus assembly protein CpaE
MDAKSEIGKQMLTATGNPESVSMNALSVVLLSASEARRQMLAAALAGTQARVMGDAAGKAALPGRDALPSFLQGDPDVLIVDLHEDTERGLDLVEAACTLDPTITVMAYARLTDPELLVRCMRAGAREFLSDPLSPASVTEALVRASVHRDEVKRHKKTDGKCLVFTGAKGGSGVTTVAANFAVALARESGESTVLVDLDLQLGDAALHLGLSSEFSTLDALANESRIDSDLVSKLLEDHGSGLKVLAAPEQYKAFQPTPSGVAKLVNILRHDFAWVVVDAGSHFDSYSQALFGIAEKVYLVTQVSVTELRNSNRFINAWFKGDAARKLEVVLNRYAPRAGEIDEASIAKALTVSPAWKIPSDYWAVRMAQNNATALVLKDGPITRTLAQMARTACGKAPEENKKRRFGLFG